MKFFTLRDKLRHFLESLSRPKTAFIPLHPVVSGNKVRRSSDTTSNSSSGSGEVKNGNCQHSVMAVAQDSSKQNKPGALERHTVEKRGKIEKKERGDNEVGDNFLNKVERNLGKFDQSLLRLRRGLSQPVHCLLWHESACRVVLVHCLWACTSLNRDISRDGIFLACDELTVSHAFLSDASHFTLYVRL